MAPLLGKLPASVIAEVAPWSARPVLLLLLLLLLAAVLAAATAERL